MLKTNHFFNEITKKDSYLLINLVFGFFPISFIMGSLIVNVNFLLFCCLGIYYLRSKILTAKLDLPIKIIFLFFLVMLFSSVLSFIKSLYFGEFNEYNFVKISKALLFLRYFLFVVIIYLLNRYNILNFKYFFLIAAVSSLIISLDVIFQYIFGYNVIGIKKPTIHSSSFFGDELVAGGYIQRFSFFSLFFSIIFFKNKNYLKFIFPVIIICISTSAILVSGNRMPLVLIIFGILFLFLSRVAIKKILFSGLVISFVVLSFIVSSNDVMKSSYESFYLQAKNTFYISKNQFGAKWVKIDNVPNENNIIKQKTTHIHTKWVPPHRQLFLTAIDTWKFNKIFGNGIKSFRFDCAKVGEDPDVNLHQQLLPDKKQRLCSNHPHNYYLEILTETGIVGLLVVIIIALLFTYFVIKYFRYLEKFNISNFILLSTLISFFLEVFPLRSTGSLFTTNNATYIILIGSIILCYKKILQIKTE